VTTEDRHALAFLGWLLLACIICWVVVIVGVIVGAWLSITVLLWLGSSIHTPNI
jgi:hypothetical protein